ncbi:MAG: Hsp20/alpha crystallin family protein [Roseimicrobium sp.]
MKLIPFSPCSLGRVTDFDEWFRHPFAGLPSLSRLFDQDDFGGLRGRLATDVHEDKDHYYAVFEVPGVRKDDVKIELTDRMLTVSVERKDKSGETETTSLASRSVSVPESVKPDAITAKLEDGLLTVTMPKCEERKARTISVA